MSEPLVSVIIPIYKVEQYLEKCLKSVLNQTYKNIEVILVNDGSPDKSGLIAQKYVRSDSRFHYFEKDNGGLSSARNYGIDRAKGDFISFIDSDDWVEYSFIDELLKAALESKADVSICNMKYIYQDGSERRNVPKIKESRTVSNAEALADLFNSRYFRNHAQNKLYRSNLFKETGIRYPVGKLYEDVFTTYRLIGIAKKIAYVPLDLYDYLQARPGSILNSGFSKRQLDILEGLDNIKQYITDNNIHELLKDDYAQLAVSNILAIANFIYPVYDKMDTAEFNEVRQTLRDTVNRYGLKNYFQNNNIQLSQKIRYFMILHAMKPYCAGMRVLRK